MTGIVLPALLIVAGLIAAASTYRGIRRGGARFYTLEREMVLRRAAVTLSIAVVLFLAAVAVLFYQRQQLVEATLPPDEQAVEEAGGTAGGPVLTTPTALFEQFPPTATATSSVPQPTETATPAVCRAVVEGTSGNGLRMRDAPQGAELSVLPEGTLLTVLEDAPIASGDIVWRKVRAVGGEEGWVAEDFLTVRGPCE